MYILTESAGASPALTPESGLDQDIAVLILSTAPHVRNRLRQWLVGAGWCVLNVIQRYGQSNLSGADFS
jgi:hypothetical protein